MPKWPTPNGYGAADYGGQARSPRTLANPIAPAVPMGGALASSAPRPQPLGAGAMAKGGKVKARAKRRAPKPFPIGKKAPAAKAAMPPQFAAAMSTRGSKRGVPARPGEPLIAMKRGGKPPC